MTYLLKFPLHGLFFAAVLTSATAQVQQGLPSQIKPDFSFSKPSEKDAKDLKDAKDPKDPFQKKTIKETKDSKLDPKAEKTKSKDLSAIGTSCYNCGVIVSVTESRKKAKPAWMSTSDPNDPTNSEQAAKNAEKQERPDRKPTDEFQKSATSPVTLNGTLSKPDTGITLHRKLGYETLVKMEDGTMKTVTTALQPAYNIGAKVRVIGNSLSPR